VDSSVTDAEPCGHVGARLATNPTAQRRQTALSTFEFVSKRLRKT
jgi:hypothetical protein